MNRTGIEWVKNPDGTQGYTWNPITGCLNHVNGLCKGGGFPCYAYKLANTRLKQGYLANTNLALGAKGGVATLSVNGQKTITREGDYADPFYPRFWEERLAQMQRGYHYRSPGESHPSGGAAPRGVFVCDMGDLFGIGIPEQWTRQVLDVINEWDNEVDRFYLLTKQPQNLIKFSPFPPNCFVGVTATGYNAFNVALDKLKCVEAKVKYISIEPLLEAIPFNMERLAYCGISWFIIGSCTGTLEDIKIVNYEHKNTNGLMPMPYGRKWTLQPLISWLKEIIEAADKVGVKVFLKENLKPLLVKERDGNEYAPLWANGGYGILRQEMPEIKDS